MTEAFGELLDSIEHQDRAKADAAEEKIVEAGCRVVPVLHAAYKARSLSTPHYFRILLKIGPDAYKAILPLMRGEGAEALALIEAVECARVSVPEAVPYLVEGLRADARDKLIRVLSAILYLHPRVEVHDSAQLPLFTEAVHSLLDLLDHGDEHVRATAAGCLAVIRPTDLSTLSRLCVKLDAELDAGFLMSYVLISVIGSYGPTAAEAIPVLKKALLFKEYHYVRVAAAEALAKIGGAAADAVPLLEEIRDTTSFQLKSETRQFQASIQKAIKRLQTCKAPGKPKVAGGDPFLLGLIDRMSAPNDSVFSSVTSTSGKAYEEARHLTDAGLIPKIAELFEVRLKGGAFHHLSFVLGWVVRNTADATGRALIVDLLGREGLSVDNRNALIFAAEVSDTQEALPIARKLLFEGNGGHAYAVLSYFGKMKDESTVDDVGRLLRQDRRCRLMAILTLDDIGSPKAIPYLMEMATRDFTSRRKDEKEWRHYARLALAKLGDGSMVPDLPASE